ncbi:GNAT family N-acetyltransferase [uncultured Jatrophihabitans sp.]|uniref:GNAT family N-acetyltransferase n=1 Tax=uncultured Jatrophihabitans sp. TaxID=1610747 RepID=UPI0035CB1388
MADLPTNGDASIGEVSLRPTVAADEGLLRELFRQAQPELDQLPEPTRSSLLDLQYRLQCVRRLSQRPEARQWTLRVGGDAVGALVLDRSGPTTWLVDLAVDESWRRRGIATAALRTVLGDVDGPVALRVRTDDRGSRDLFEAVGFGYRLSPQLSVGDVEMVYPAGADTRD